MKNKKIDDKIVNFFVARLKQQFGKQIEKIILFGSRARGDNELYSDYDFLVVCKNLSEEMKKYVDELENDILLSNFVLISTYMITKEKFEKRVYEPYLMNIKKEGISV